MLRCGVVGSGCSIVGFKEGVREGEGCYIIYVVFFIYERIDEE